MPDDLFQRAERALRARVSEPAFRHCMRVSETAGELAMTYGQDAEQARLAGLLHDWDRDLDHSELIESANRHGIELAEIDLRWPYLLHAKTGAADAADEFPDLPAEVISAIRNHTVGSASMSDLDKVVFLADTLEPARHHGAVNDLREMIGRVGLDELFAETYRDSLMRIVEHRRWIHPETVTVWNALIARSRR